jgi:signal transduction histidine kinase
MTNAMVSHELRNPLNSIVAQNILKKKLYEELRAKCGDDHETLIILDKLEDGHRV